MAVSLGWFCVHSPSPRAGPALISLPLQLPAWRAQSEGLVTDLPRLRGSGDYSLIPVLPCFCPLLAQVHGSRLRLPQVSPADSGEYVCRVQNESGPKEASIVVSVLHSPDSGPSYYTPGRSQVGKPWDLLAVPREVPVYSLVTLGQALTLHYLLGEMRGLKVGIKLIWLTRGSVMSVLFSEFIRKQ